MRLCLALLIILMVPLTLRSVSHFTHRVVAVVEGQDHGGDYISYWAAGKLADGRAYDIEAMRQMELSLRAPLAADPLWEAQRGQVLRQPPVVLPAVKFLAARHPAVGFMLCTLVEAFLLGVLIGVTTRWVAGRPLAGVAWVSLCLGWAPLWEAFHFARWSAVVAAVAFLAALACLRSGDCREGGLSLTGMLLHQPFYFLPLALCLGLTRRRRALAGLTVGAALLTLVSVLAGGAEGYLHSQLDAPRGLHFNGYDLMYNFRGLWDRWLGSWPPALLCSLAVWGAACVAWRRPGPTHFSLLGLALVLASPVTHGPDLLLLVPIVALAGPWSRPALPVALGLFVWLSPFPGLRSAVVLLLAAGFAYLVRRR